MDFDWRQQAACAVLGPELFFAIDDAGPDPEAMAAAARPARNVCDGCPVRRECFADCMTAEDGVAATARWGVFAGLTPAQRSAAAKRGTVHCPACGAVLDPTDVRFGLIRCPELCGLPTMEVGSIDERGDRWTNRHTVLARSIVSWLAFNVEAGGEVPRPADMARHLEKPPRMADVTRVYQALTADGTIERVGFVYTFVGLPHGAGAWRPQHTAVIEEW